MGGKEQVRRGKMRRRCWILDYSNRELHLEVNEEKEDLIAIRIDKKSAGLVVVCVCTKNVRD